MFYFDGQCPVAKQRQIEYLNEKGYGSWKRYDELVPTINATTGEDFVNPSAILLAANEVLSERKLSQMSETDIGLMGTTERSLKRWLDVNGASGSDQILKAIKDRIFDDLTSASIVPAYYDYLKAVLVFTKSSPAN